MSEPTTPATLENDGIIYGIAKGCAEAMREIADAATPERLIRLAARQMAEGGEATPERVRGHLYATLNALSVTVEQLREADSDCARNQENPCTKPQ